MREGGHVDLKTPLVIMVIIAAIAAEHLYKYKTGGSLAAMIDWWWAGGIAGGLVLLIALYALATYKRIRIEQAGGRTIVHFDGGQFEVLPEPPDVSRWHTGGAFGQPSVYYISLKRGGEVLWSGAERDGERLLAALTQQPLAGGDAPKV